MNDQVVLTWNYSTAKLCGFFGRSCSLRVWCILIRLLCSCCLCSLCLFWNVILQAWHGHYSSEIRTTTGLTMQLSGGAGTLLPENI